MFTGVNFCNPYESSVRKIDSHFVDDKNAQVGHSVGKCWSLGLSLKKLIQKPLYLTSMFHVLSLVEDSLETVRPSILSQFAFWYMILSYTFY